MTAFLKPCGSRALCVLGLLFSFLPKANSENLIRNVKFLPAPGETLTIPESTILARTDAVAADHLSGTIKVSPPAGQCISLTTSQDRPDRRICLPSKIPFFLKDIDEKGHITWRFTTGGSDPGSIVSWPTPYRVGKAVVSGHRIAGHSFPLYITGCRAENLPVTGRRIILTLADRRFITIRFPDEHVMIKQPEPFPNLFTQGETVTKGGIPAAGVKSLFTMALEKQAAEAARGEDVLGNPRLLPLRPTLPVDEYWETHPRGAFILDGRNFLGTQSIEGGSLTECRYRLGGYLGQKNLGSLECQATPEFQWIILPISCIESVR